MPVPPAAVDLLSALAPVLTRWGRWYVFGAQAVIVHGVPRLSADVDVTLVHGHMETKNELETKVRVDARVANRETIQATKVR